ncbi:trigger factor [Chloroflexota bacterium]
MKVTREKIEESQAFLIIEMEPVEVEESLGRAYCRLVENVKIPGFRKGKAPRAVLERYVSRESLLEDALNDLIPDAYERAIKEQEIEAIAQPRIEITQTEPLLFKAVVPLKPIIKLGDYHSIQVTPRSVEVTENDINSAIEELRHKHATWEPVEHPLEFNDLVTLDIWSNIEDKPLINQKGVQYQVLQDLPFPAPGFAEQLVGMKRNEEKEFKLKFASDAGSELAEKEASFKVRINEIKKEILPELNDEFAKEVNADFKTLDSLRERLSSLVKLRAEERARLDFEERLIEAVVGLTEVEFPPVYVEAEIGQLLSQHFQKGNHEMEEYLKSVNKTEAELREELRPLATKRVTRSLVVSKVAEEEKIEISDSEVDAEVENLIKETERKNRVEDVLNTPQVRESIRQTLLARNTIHLLSEIAKGK